jgi:hypothetical protein
VKNICLLITAIVFLNEIAIGWFFNRHIAINLAIDLLPGSPATTKNKEWRIFDNYNIHKPVMAGVNKTALQ